KAVIKCIGRDGNQECSFSRDEKVGESVGIRYKSRRPFQRLQMSLLQKTRMATVIAKVATHSRQMATDFGKMATVVLNLATGPAQVATQAQMIAVILIKAMIKCIGRDGKQEYSFSRDE